MSRYRIFRPINLLKNNKDKMYDYIIIKLLDKQYIAKRYEVKI